MSSLGQLTAGIAHEINNPINFVAANVNPLKRDIHLLFETIERIEEISGLEIEQEEKHKKIHELKEEQDFDYLKIEIRHLLKGIQEGASRTAEIVKGLRTFSRVDEDRLSIFQINEGLESTVTISEHFLKGIEINRHLGEVAPIECFPGKINQLFLNILTNAAFAIKEKFGEQAGGLITLETSQTGQTVVVAIRDNGKGMDEETRNKLFEPFFTTKDVGEGTGLGMSIVFGIVREHQGEIEINSQPGIGTEIRLSFPLQQRKQDENDQ